MCKQTAQGSPYLFFYDRHGYHGLSKEKALAMHSHIADAFAEWIGRSTYFDAVPLLLEAGTTTHGSHAGNAQATDLTS